MQAIDRDRVQELTADLEAVLLQFGTDHGVVVSIGGICFYEPDQAPYRSSPVFEPEPPRDQGADRFAAHAAHFGLSVLDYGKMVVINKKQYKLVDIHPRYYKYPIIGLSARGSRYKFSASAVRKALQKSE